MVHCICLFAAHPARGRRPAVVAVALLPSHRSQCSPPLASPRALPARSRPRHAPTRALVCWVLQASGFPLSGASEECLSDDEDDVAHLASQRLRGDAGLTKTLVRCNRRYRPAALAPPQAQPARLAPLALRHPARRRCRRRRRPLQHALDREPCRFCSGRLSDRGRARARGCRDRWISQGSGKVGGRPVASLAGGEAALKFRQIRWIAKGVTRTGARAGRVVRGQLGEDALGSALPGRRTAGIA
jgi:hypothetical protein